MEQRLGAQVLADQVALARGGGDVHRGHGAGGLGEDLEGHLGQRRELPAAPPLLALLVAAGALAHPLSAAGDADLVRRGDGVALAGPQRLLVLVGLLGDQRQRGSVLGDAPLDQAVGHGRGGHDLALVAPARHVEQPALHDLFRRLADVGEEVVLECELDDGVDVQGLAFAFQDAQGGFVECHPNPLLGALVFPAVRPAR
ncbi:MAG: hypothetical protein QM765_05635 [Myxococcales bacterium]